MMTSEGPVIERAPWDEFMKVVSKSVALVLERDTIPVVQNISPEEEEEEENGI